MTVYSADEDAQRQEFSTKDNLLIAISTLVNDTYSPPRSLTKSFLRSETNNKGKTRRLIKINLLIIYHHTDDF